MTDNGPQEGDKAPEFCLPEASEERVCLYQELEKGPLILAFYPTDFGTICTLEFMRLKEMQSDLRAAGVRLIGISVNTTYSHRSWKDKMEMDIPLLSDIDAAVSKMYDVMSSPISILKGYSTRAIFVIARDGTITYRWVSPGAHAQPEYDVVLEKARELGEPSGR